MTVSNDGHSMARALNLCLFTYIENILDGYLFGYCLTHRLRTMNNSGLVSHGGLQRLKRDDALATQPNS
jgi:hypothetical protein